MRDDSDLTACDRYLAIVPPVDPTRIQNLLDHGKTERNMQSDKSITLKDHLTQHHQKFEYQPQKCAKAYEFSTSDYPLEVSEYKAAATKGRQFRQRAALVLSCDYCTSGRLPRSPLFLDEPIRFHFLRGRWSDRLMLISRETMSLFQLYGLPRESR